MRALIRRAFVTIGAAGVLAAGMVAAAAAVTGTEAALPANAGSNPEVTLSSVSCASAGNCTAVGHYGDTSGNSSQGLLLTQTAGTWAAGTEAALPKNANSIQASTQAVSLNSVSCASAGNCTAVGRYLASSGNSQKSLTTQGLLLTQTAGTWATGTQAPLPANAASNPNVHLNSVSCASAGNCTAVGTYATSLGNSQGLLLTQTAGTWATGTEAALPANAASSPAVSLLSLSCASAGNCTAVGRYFDSSGNSQGLLLTQTGGTWAAGTEAPLPANAGSNPAVSLTSVSCASAGNCTAVGSYTDSSGNGQGVLLTQTGGTWATGTEAALPANTASNPAVSLTSVSCASAGNCSAVGTYIHSAGKRQGLLLTQTAGTWAAGTEAALPTGVKSNPVVSLPSVSCALAGNCIAVGAYTDSSGNGHAVLWTQTAGTWAAGTQAPLPANAASNPSDANLRSVSCASAGNCTAVGFYEDSSRNGQGLLVTQTSPT